MTNPNDFSEDGTDRPHAGALQHAGVPQYGAIPQYDAPQYGVAPQQGAAPATEPDSNLGWAILSTVLCCLPLGIVSIVKATSVGRLWAMGDYAGAQQAADDAKKFAIWSAVVSVVFWLIFSIVWG